MRTDTEPFLPPADIRLSALLERAAELGGDRAIARYIETQPAPDRLLDVDDVAALFGVHKITVRTFVQRGIIPRPVLIGNKLHRWRRRDIVKHLDALPVAPVDGGDDA